MRKGDRIEMVEMPDDPCPVPPGTKGTVEFVQPVDFGGGDRFTQVGVKWDDGRTLMVVIPPDQVKVLK